MEKSLKGVPVEGFTKKSRQAAAEGIVLLKNEDNILPFTKEDKISVFGRPQLDYYRSGTGSGGAVNVEYATNIIDGFKSSNLSINEELVTDYVKNSPYCRFNYQTQHGKVEVVFKMNEAGLSKLQADWLVMVKDALDDGRWAAHRTTENQEGALETIVLGLDYSILLEYKLKGPDEGYVQVWLNKDGTPVSNESGD